MTSTLWFWIVALILFLLILWFIKKYLGRILLICLFLCVLFFVYKWIFPTGAAVLIRGVQSVPVQVTNYLNHNVLKNNIELSSEDGQLRLDQKGAVVEKSPGEDEQLVQEEPVVKKESWFKRLFKRKSSSQQEDQNGTIEGNEKEKADGESIGTGDEGIRESDITQVGTGNVDLLEEETDLENDGEIYYIPSNPKPASSQKKTTSSSSLSAEDLREAREIFGN